MASAALEDWLIQTQDRLQSLELGHDAQRSELAIAQTSSSLTQHRAGSSGSLQQVQHPERSYEQSLQQIRQQQHTTALQAIGDIELLASSPPSLATLTASSLLLAGLDAKAILSQGTNGLQDVSIHGKDFSRADFTGLQFVNVCGLESSFARSIWYRVRLQDSCFVDCNFAGSIVKRLSVTSSSGVHQTEMEEETHDGMNEENDEQQHDETRRTGSSSSVVTPFQRCDCRYAMIDLTDTADEWIAATTNGEDVIATTPLFVDCDFQFAQIKLGERAARDPNWRRKVLQLFHGAKNWNSALVE